MSTPDIILKLSNIESYYGPIMAIRGISLDLAGTLMAWIAVVGVLVTGPGGAATDRYAASLRGTRSKVTPRTRSPRRRSAVAKASVKRGCAATRAHSSRPA